MIRSFDSALSGLAGILALGTAIPLLVWGLLSATLRITEYGLFTSFPWPYFIGLSLAVLGVYFSRSRGWAAFGLVIVITALYAAPYILERVPRFPASFYYFRGVDYILRQGSLRPDVDLWQNWPGALLLFATLAEVTGLQDASILISIVPYFLMLFYLSPLYWLLTKAPEPRAPLVGVLIFALFNWTNQNYFSAQGPAFLIALCLAGLVVQGEGKPDTPSKRYVWLLLFSGLAITHFLTAAWILFLIALASMFKGRRRERINLLLLSISVAVAWLLFWASHVFSQVGMEGLRAILSPQLYWRLIVGARFLATSPAHGAINGLRLGFSGLLVVLALAGLLTRWRQPDRKATPSTSSTMPNVLLIVAGAGTGLFPYGGETPVRTFLFALPALAYFAVGLLGKFHSWFALGVLMALLPPVHVLAHYGNEAIEYIPRQELTGAIHLRQYSVPGTLIAGIPFMGLEKIEQTRILFNAGSTNEAVSDARIRQLAPSYVALNGLVDNVLRFYFAEREGLRPIRLHLDTESNYSLIYDNRSAWIYASPSLSDGP